MGQASPAIIRKYRNGKMCMIHGALNNKREVNIFENVIQPHQNRSPTPAPLAEAASTLKCDPLFLLQIRDRWRE